MKRSKKFLVGLISTIIIGIGVFFCLNSYFKEKKQFKDANSNAMVVPLAITSSEMTKYNINFGNWYQSTRIYVNVGNTTPAGPLPDIYRK